MFALTQTRNRPKMSAHQPRNFYFLSKRLQPRAGFAGLTCDVNPVAGLSAIARNQVVGPLAGAADHRYGDAPLRGARQVAADEGASPFSPFGEKAGKKGFEIGQGG